jgi:hypothetical protein
MKIGLLVFTAALISVILFLLIKIWMSVSNINKDCKGRRRHHGDDTVTSPIVPYSSSYKGSSTFSSSRPKSTRRVYYPNRGEGYSDTLSYTSKEPKREGFMVGAQEQLYPSNSTTTSGGSCYVSKDDPAFYSDARANVC